MSSAWRAGLKVRASIRGRRRSTTAARADVTNAKGGNDARPQDWNPRRMAGGSRLTCEARGRARQARSEGDRAAASASLGSGGEGLRARDRGREEDARRTLRRALAAP